MQHYEIEEYVTEDGNSPFTDWLLHLKDTTGKSKVLARIRRACFGNFGDAKAIKGVKDLYEMREHSGQAIEFFIPRSNEK